MIGLILEMKKQRLKILAPRHPPRKLLKIRGVKLKQTIDIVKLLRKDRDKR